MKLSNKFDNYHKGSKLSNSKLANSWLRVVKRLPFLNDKINLVLNLPKGARVLDVGCGMFTFLKYIHRIRPDLELHGIDISNDVLSVIPKYIKFKKASGDKIPFKKDYFDLVICQHVFEHILNPGEFIAEFKRVSRKFILAVTPSYKSTFLWDSVSFWNDHTHLRPFTRVSLRKLFESNNLKVLVCKNVRDINLPLPLLILFLPINFFVKLVTLNELASNILIKRSVMVIAKK